MSRKNSFLTVTDQFCGAGGSSQGVHELAKELGGGLEVRLALNHWKLAIETHNTNFPDTIHHCTDVSASDPRIYPSTDILVTSPECKTHSPGGGNTHKKVKSQLDLYDKGIVDPATERSRATMWDVPRFAEYHNYNVIVVENVVEAKTGWALFDTWLQSMHVLGYNHKCVFFNSMHAKPTPQSRDRMYVVFWKKGNKAPDLNFTPTAHCSKCIKDVDSVQTWKDKRKPFGKYRTQYVYCCPTCSTIVEPYYHASFNIIDWSNAGTRIGDRKKPLSENSERRVRVGLDKYSEPFIVNNKQMTGVDFRIKSSYDHLQSLTTEHGFGLVLPFIIQSAFNDDSKVKSVLDPLTTTTTHQNNGLLMPFITGTDNTSAPPQIRTVMEPIQTQVTRQSTALVIPPFIAENKGTSNARDIFSPLAGVTTVGYHSVVTNESWNAFISHYYSGSVQNKHITDTLGTQTVTDRAALVTYDKPNYEDCYYRMLTPLEVKLGMAFGRHYKVLGSGRDQVKQCGNAVTPPVMKMIMERCVQSLK